MNVLERFIEEYATAAIYALITALGGVAVFPLKEILKKYIRNRTKKEVSRKCVAAVPRFHKNLSEEERYEKTVEAVTETLAGRGIKVSELEAMVCIENAIKEGNG